MTGSSPLSANALSIVCIAVLLLSISFPSIGAGRTLNGLVSKPNGEAIAGATIRTEGRTRPVVTDKRGFFSIAVPLTADSVEFTVTHVGFAPAHRVVSPLPDTIRVTLIPAPYLTETINVSAVRTGSSATAVTQIQRNEVEEIFVGQEPQYVFELLSPSLIATSESGTGFGNYGTLRMRGFDQNRINITFNGIPLNDMIDQGVFFSNTPDLLNSVHSVQIVRGTGVTSNGTASFGGAISMEGVELHNTTAGGSVQVSGGSFGTARLSVAANTGMQEGNVALHVRATTFSSDGYRDHTSSDASSFFLTGAWYGTHDIIKITGYAGRSSNGLAYFAVPAEVAQVNPRTNLNDPNDRDAFGQRFLQLQHVRALSDKAAISTTLYYGGAGGDFLYTWRDSTSMYQTNYPLSNNHWGIISNIIAADVSPGLNITGGLHAYTFRRSNWEHMSPDFANAYYSDRTQKDEVTVFAKAEWSFDDFTVEGDLQARSPRMIFTMPEAMHEKQNAVPTHSWLFFNPRLSANYNISKAITTCMSVGRTGREPMRFDMLGGTQISKANINVLLAPNTVRPEYITTLDVGLRADGGPVQATINAFSMWLQDEIAPIGQFIEQQFVQLRKNMASSRRYGLEAQASVELAKDLLFTFSAATMKGQIDRYEPENLSADTAYSNVSPVLLPSYMGSASLRYRITPHIVADARHRFIGKMYLELTNDPQFTLPAYQVTDLRLEINPHAQLRITLMANNLTDAIYANDGATTLTEAGQAATWFVQPPRNFFLIVHLTI